MVFNTTSARNGVIQEIEKATDLGIGYISSDANRLADFTSDINNANHEIWHTIFTSSGNWQYDDGNYSDLPSGASDLVSGTSKYALPSEALTVQRIEVKDPNGSFYQLTPITKEMINGEAVDEFMKEDGQPSFYRLVNGTAEIFPAPNYSSTGGFKVYFDRGSVDFVTSDTTKTPGFASPYHKLLPIKVAINWLDIKQPTSPTLARLLVKEDKLEKALIKFYGLRFKDLKPRISRAYQSFN